MPCPQPNDPTPTNTAPAPTQATLCVRCKTNPAITIFRDSIYCQPCALAVFYTKAKSGLEYARGAGLAKYVAAAKAEVAESSSQASTSTAASPSIGSKRINNGGGNAEVNVSANIAIAFSGGNSSRALLRTATQYFRPETAFVNRDARRRKARGEETDSFAPVETAKPRGAANAAGRFNEVGKIFVFYIDDSAIIERGVDRTESARKMVEEEGCADLHFVPLKIEDVFRSSADVYEGAAWKLVDVDGQQLSSSVTPIADPRQAIKNLFASLHPANTPRTGASSARTRVEDLHRILINTLLRHTAQKHDCAALLLGDTATRISIRLIEDLAKGAGHKLPVQGGDAVWIDELLVVRPFKSHLMQEVDFYTSALGLQQLLPEQHVVPPTVSTGDVLGNQNSNVPTMDKSSIARLTETFILNLEKGVPSTVTTIGKTGSKLVLNASSSSSSSDSAESAANSTSAFQQVGPTVSLRNRLTASEQLSNLTISEPRIGSRGMKLATTSASCFRHDTTHGCALCAMPTQPNARHWKRDITISSLAETAPSASVEKEEEKGWIDLADHLCYACLLVLSPPAAGEAGSMLPAYVLQRIQQKQDVGKGDVGRIDVQPGVEDDEAAQSVPDGQCGSHKPVAQPLERSEIKAQINEFLLDDDA